MGVSDNNKRIAKNTIFLYFRLLIVMAVQLYTTRLVLALLGVVDFGLYGVIGGVVVIFTTLNSTFASATSRFITVALGKEDMRQLKLVFNSALIIHILLAFSVFILCETAGLWFVLNKMVIPENRFSAAQWVYQFSVITCLFSMVQIPFNALIIAHERMNVYALVGLFEALGRLGIAFGMKVSPMDRLIFYALCQMLLSILLVVFYQLYCRIHYHESRFCLAKDKSLYKDMISFSAFDMVGSASVMLQGQGINMILNVFCGPVVNAARTVSYQIQGAVSQFAGNFMTAVNPQIVKYYVKDELDNMLTLVKRSSILSFLLLFVIILPLSLEIRYVLTLWLGNYPEYAPVFTVLILINALISAFRSPRIRIFHATGHIKRSNIITGSILCLAFPLGYVFLRMGFKPTYVFYGIILTSLIADCSNLLILKRYISYSIRNFLLTVHFRCILTAVFASLIPILVFLQMKDSFLRLVCIVLTSVLSTAVFGWIFAVNKADREVLASMLRRRLWKN